MTKSKYGDLIRKARQPESQQVAQPDDQIDASESQQNTKPVDQLVVKPDDQITSQPDREVNLCVKVPESLRRHWAAESKRHGVTMTQVIIQALSDQLWYTNLNSLRVTTKLARR